jgi:ferrochelatase
VSETSTKKPPADGATGAFPAKYFDAILVVAFGGPEGMDDVMPFLENVTRGRNVPRERLEEVAHHYERFGGASPINAQNRALISALGPELDAHGIDLPIYLGNRNWHPFLRDTLGRMREDGVQRALAFFTTGFSSYSSCRQYRENILEAQAEIGSDAPEVMRTRAFYNHPGFVEANADHVAAALETVGPGAHVLFTAHSIPQAMASRSRYETQLAETARLVAERVGRPPYELVYQSRSGPPHVPWLEPDVCDTIRALASDGVRDVVVSPIGFVSDHMEILFDLDVEARETAEEVGIGFARAPTAGTHPAFVGMVRELIQERLDEDVPRRSLGRFGASHDICMAGCCLPG